MRYLKKRTCEILKHITFHTCILARGILKVLHGTLIAGLFVVSILGFNLVIIDDGYVAVLDFVLACILLAIALGNTYWIGIKRKDV